MFELAVSQSIEVGQSQSVIKDLIAREVCKMFNWAIERIFFLFHIFSFLFFHSFFSVFLSLTLFFLEACSRMFGVLILKTCAIIIILQFCKTSIIISRDLIKEST